ncbi:PREDICTED: dnaJ homolog subfamily C member 17-like [Priapulus caudatus]|uniref:DnaJ homolog subfamily C member 17-like n=1 Tax=Priapulus caudatus TaxID=37621 RepID=A0ABM1EWY3_PRICU|nr:PREDICTED: dnaJ homolog subfamily C member 17-like [Priapulus caudatus]
MADVMKLDLYAILEVDGGATEQEIVKAYRRKALRCHPDKNPDNPRAAELFHELSRALEVLTDAAARSAYDKVIKARDAARVRHRELDSKRRKLKEDLDTRENSAREGTEKREEAGRKLQREIERLRKEGSRLLEREQEMLKEQMKVEPRSRETPAADGGEQTAAPPRLKVTWRSARGDASNGGYSRDTLARLLSAHGDLSHVIVSAKRNGSAIVEFVTTRAAAAALRDARGLPANPLTLAWLSGEPPANGGAPARPTGGGAPLPASAAGDDFEAAVLARLLQAQRDKRADGAMRHVSGVMRHVSGVMRHVSGVVRHVSGVVRHRVSGVMRHVSGVMRLVSGVELIMKRADGPPAGGASEAPRDGENLVLRRARQQEERRRLIERMKEDEST